MTCDVQTLISANPCLYTLTPRMLRVLQAQMLCGIFNNLDSGTAITCDIQALLDDAECFNALNDFQLEVVITQLLCEISGLL